MWEALLFMRRDVASSLKSEEDANRLLKIADAIVEAKLTSASCVDLSSLVLGAEKPIEIDNSSYQDFVESAISYCVDHTDFAALEWLGQCMLTSHWFDDAAAAIEKQRWLLGLVERQADGWKRYARRASAESVRQDVGTMHESLQAEKRAVDVGRYDLHDFCLAQCLRRPPTATPLPPCTCRLPVEFPKRRLQHFLTSMSFGQTPRSSTALAEGLLCYCVLRQLPNARTCLPPRDLAPFLIHSFVFCNASPSVMNAVANECRPLTIRDVVRASLTSTFSENHNLLDCWKLQFMLTKILTTPSRMKTPSGSSEFVRPTTPKRSSALALPLSEKAQTSRFRTEKLRASSLWERALRPTALQLGRSRICTTP